ATFRVITRRLLPRARGKPVPPAATAAHPPARTDADAPTRKLRRETPIALVHQDTGGTHRPSRASADPTSARVDARTRPFRGRGAGAAARSAPPRVLALLHPGRDDECLQRWLVVALDRQGQTCAHAVELGEVGDVGDAMHGLVVDREDEVA